MREFILFASRAKTSPNFSLDDLRREGRMDLVCRSVLGALCVSNGIRKDTIIHVAMNGPKFPPKIVSFYGESIVGIEPDEKCVAKFIRSALKVGIRLGLNEEKEVCRGVRVAKRSFESFVKEKAKTKKVYYLHPKGADVRNVGFGEDAVFVLGDSRGLIGKSENLLNSIGAERIKLGPKMLFASHCIVIVNNELDRI